MSSQSYFFNPQEDRMTCAGSGLGLPCMTTVQRLAIVAGEGDSGMQVFDTTIGAVFFWTGTTWEQLGAGGVSLIQTQSWNTPGTYSWTNPSPTVRKRILLLMVGGGGGGGSGRKGLATTNRPGGGGGAPGSFVYRWVYTDELPASVTVVVGAGGSGGASQTVNSTGGNSGVAGGTSSFDRWLAVGGPFGSGGNGPNGARGVAGNTWYNFLIGFTPSPATDGGTGQVSVGSSAGISTAGLAGGGGGGGGANSTTASGGGSGSGFSNLNLGTPSMPASAGGVAPGGAGANGISPTGYWGIGGSGGGGGAASNTAANGGSGGNGGSPGGGGGGGGAGTDTLGNSGAGGTGGNGLVEIVVFP